ncbi:MAG: hypothetical protein IPI73_14410 [Betaproteobacteria bacterium]|nr:hypothetical protein [Betaproteobacteria bacterium]
MPRGVPGAKAAAEPTINATIAAIANAIAHATGHRFHELPMNPARVLGMLAARAAKPLALKPWKRPFNADRARILAGGTDMLVGCARASTIRTCWST